MNFERDRLYFSHNRQDIFGCLLSAFDTGNPLILPSNRIKQHQEERVDNNGVDDLGLGLTI